MANPEKGPGLGQPELKTDSLDCDFFELTDEIGTVDTTVRPMRDRLRVRLGLPPLGQQPTGQAPPEQSA